MSGLDVRGLTVEYTGGGYVVRALDELSVLAPDGELVLLLGPSGCGKTTFLSCLAGILTPTSGSIRFRDKVVTSLQGSAMTDYRRNTVGVVFQSFNLVPSLSALENVDTPLRAAGMRGGPSRERAVELLAQVGLEDRMHHRPGDLSGGQQQRVAIARALAHDPPLLLADEPTAHLDYVQVEGVLRLLRSLARPGRMVVCSTHDPRLVPLADRVVELAGTQEAFVIDPELVTLAAGEVLFRQGERGGLIYVVEEGQIELVRELADGSQELLAVSGPGEYFGELGPLIGFPRAATARAKDDVVVTGYSVMAFKERVGGHHLAELVGRHGGG
jgi:putative ABC transport system ATP-binding protein